MLGKRHWLNPSLSPGIPDVSNYRPISLVPVMSKILEKIVSEHLTQYLETHQYIHLQQYGFRQNNSTESAICTLLENIVQPLDKGNIGVQYSWT